MKNIKRVITYFNKNSADESLVGEINLSQDLNLEELQKLFQVENDNPLYDCYPIKENEAEYFETKHGINFDLGKYDYFAECEAE